MKKKFPNENDKKRFENMREKSFCPHFPLCGGCEFDPTLLPTTWEEFSSNPLFLKRNIHPVLICGEKEACRYKARLAIRLQEKNIAIGLFERDSHRVVDMETCLLHHPTIIQGTKGIKEWMQQENIAPYDEKREQGLLRYLQMVVEKKTGRLQLVIVCNCDQKDPQVKELHKQVKRLFLKNEKFHSIWLNFQPNTTNTILGKDWQLCEGEEWLWQSFLGHEIAFHPGAFVQAHMPLFEKMIFSICEKLEHEKSILELYAGVGVMGICLAKENKKVKLVENNPLSYLSFCQTKKKNPFKIDYVLEDVDDYVEKNPIVEEVILVDPPRKGLGEKVLSCFRSLEGKRLVYVSCNEKSFLRDLKALEEANWTLIGCDGYLFFPGTERFEILAYLEKK